MNARTQAAICRNIFIAAPEPLDGPARRLAEEEVLRALIDAVSLNDQTEVVELDPDTQGREEASALVGGDGSITVLSAQSNATLWEHTAYLGHHFNRETNTLCVVSRRVMRAIVEESAGGSGF